MECPFQLTAQRSGDVLAENFDWVLSVDNPNHNHPATRPIAHPSLRSLAMTSEVQDAIRQEAKSGARPQEMLVRIRGDENEDNPRITDKDVRNTEAAIRRQALGPLTPAQALLQRLLHHENDWWIRYLKDANEHVTHLFYSRASAHKFVKLFWEDMEFMEVVDACMWDTTATSYYIV